MTDEEFVELIEELGRVRRRRNRDRIRYRRVAPELEKRFRSLATRVAHEEKRSGPAFVELKP